MIKYLQTCGFLILLLVSVRSEEQQRKHQKPVPVQRLPDDPGYSKAAIRYLRQQLARPNPGPNANLPYHVKRSHVNHAKRRQHHYEYKYPKIGSKVSSVANFLRRFHLDPSKKSFVKSGLSQRDYKQMGLDHKIRKGRRENRKQFDIIGIASTEFVPKKQPQRFPDTHFNKDQFSNLRVPSSSFCAKMKMSSSDQYFTLPWWYNYCQSMNERKDKKWNHDLYNLPVYMRVVNRIRETKKKMMEERLTKDTFNYNHNGFKTV